MRRITSLIAFIVVAVIGASGFAAVPAAAAPADDVGTVVSRLEQYYLGQGDQIIIANGIYLARASEALDYAASQKEDGSWADVDYADRTSSANGKTWSAYIALYRMLAMTQAYRDPAAKGHGDRRLVDAVDRALRHWDRVDPGNQNWWETEIGESIAMGRISMFLGEELSDEAFQVSLAHNTGKLDPVGANGAWRTSNYIFEALATRDLDKVTEGFATIVATIAVDDSGTVKEAVQPDASFWAHGAQLYSEGYGMVLFTYAALWADVARGTALAFTRDQLDSIAFYIAGGTRWLIRGEIGMLYLNYRPPKTIQGVTSHSSEFIEPLQRMARTDPLYATAYQAVLDGILGTTRDNGVTGNKYFWRSEFSSHLRDDYGIFTRLNSSRTFGAELRTSYRDELGNPVYWNAMGSTAIQVNNREYLDLGPAFDWWHYPGVTAPDAKRTERGVENRGRNGDGASFTGGVSNGRYGMSVLTLDSAATTAQKSYFSFDDQMVALGAGIRSTADAAVHTTVNQAVAKPNAVVDGRPVVPGTDAQSAEGARWAYNDEVGYVFAADQDVKVSNKSQTGSWEGQEPVSRDAYTVYVDHGVAPESATYDYTVLPAATPAEVEAYAAQPAVRTLRNDAEVQAVRHDGLGITMGTFAAAGSLDLGEGRALTVDQPALVLLDERGDTPVVSIANPDRPGLTLVVTLTGGETEWNGTFALGAGASTGKTVTAPLVAGSQAPSSAHSASSTAPDRAVEALGDGDPGTLWESDGAGLQWIAEELPRGSWATKVGIDWADDFASDFLVQTSSDGRTWTDQARITGGTGGVSEVPIAPTAASRVRVVLLDGVGERYGVRELTVASTVNLAVDAGSRASGYAGYNLVHNIADGDRATRWRGNNSDNAWAQVDLGSSQPVSTVRLHWEAAFARSYRIQLSDDGTSWRDVFSTPAAGSDGGLDVITLDGQAARFVRMQTVKRALDSGPSLWELEVFADRSVADAQPVTDGKGNLALGRPATADSVHNDNPTIVAAKATDGSLATKWSSGRENREHWLQVDLGSVRSVSRAVVNWETGTSNDYRVEGSVDGSTWTELARVAAVQPSLRHVHDFDPADVRYIRVAGMPATKYGLNIWELEVYGGFTFECVATATTVRDGEATVAATVSPQDPRDGFEAASTDTAVASVDGTPRAGADGRVEVDVATHAIGATSLLLTHALGEETAWCAVNVVADSARLEERLRAVDGLDSREYTPDSWAPVLGARESAKETLSVISSSQEQVDAAEAALAAVLAALVRLDAVPSAPLGVSASATGDTVEARWSPPESEGGSAVVGYEVAVGERLVVQTEGAVLHVRIPGVEPGEHAVSVRAKNAGGWSVASEPVTVLVDPVVSPLPELHVADGLRAGGGIEVSGTGFTAGVEYRIELRSRPVELGKITAGADGSFLLEGRLPADAVGEHTVVATQDGRDIASTHVRIAAAGDGPGGSEPGTGRGEGALPATGGGLGWLPWAAGTALLLLGVGGILVRCGWRRAG
ncbi:discoidin domain-containing protein [Microbacterium sp. S308A+]|uniref:discoidin domain-containing protein n=1 Tax=Microbacterium sp. S308A+ TaxID=3415135 RepID=UPI003C7BAC29